MWALSSTSTELPQISKIIFVLWMTPRFRQVWWNISFLLHWNYLEALASVGLPCGWYWLLTETLTGVQSRVPTSGFCLVAWLAHSMLVGFKRWASCSPRVYVLNSYTMSLVVCPILIILNLTADRSIVSIFIFSLHYTYINRERKHTHVNCDGLCI